MKKTNKILALLLSAVTCFSAVGCSNTSSVDMSDAPDYSAFAGDTFMTYGYHSPVPSAVYMGSYGEVERVVDENGKPIDFRTTERYKEYYDAGLNTLFLQANDYYNGDYGYENSDLKRIFAMCREAGVDKVIVADRNIHYKLSEADSSTRKAVKIYGTPETDADKKRFAEIYGNTNTHSWEDLVNYTKGKLKDYIHEPNFYGVMLSDEPSWDRVEQVATAYKAVKAAFPLAKQELEAEGITVTAQDIFVQVNLLPMYTSKQYLVDLSSYDVEPKQTEAFRDYVSRYLEISEATNITMDSYCLKQDGMGEDATYSTDTAHFPGLQIFSEVANSVDRDVSIGGLCSSTELATDPSYKAVSLKAPTASDMYYQLNSYIMFGFSSFAYYTYWAKTSTADSRREGTTFIDRKGNKNPLYYDMAEIHSELQELAPVIKQFKYEKMKIYKDDPVDNGSVYVRDCVQAENLDGLKTVSVGSGQIAMVTQLNDANKNQKMFAIMNTQPAGQNVHGPVGLNAVMEFDSKYKAVKMYFRGKYYNIPLDEGKLEVNLSAGHAAYIMPF